MFENIEVSVWGCTTYVEYTPFASEYCDFDNFSTAVFFTCGGITSQVSIRTLQFSCVDETYVERRESQKVLKDGAVEFKTKHIEKEILVLES